MSNRTIQEAAAEASVTLMDEVSKTLTDTDPEDMAPEAYLEEVGKLMRAMTMHALKFFYLGLVLGMNRSAMAGAVWESQKATNPGFAKNTEELADSITVAP